MNKGMMRIVATLFAIVPLTLTAGCESEETEVGAAVEADGVLVAASQQSTDELGLYHWRVTFVADQLRARGYDGQERERARVVVAPWRGAHPDAAIPAASQGVWVIGEALEDDEQLIAAVIRDSQDLISQRGGTSFRSSSAADISSCLALMVDAIAACGASDLVCIENFVGQGECLQCFASPGPGPGPEPITGGGASTTCPEDPDWFIANEEPPLCEELLLQ